MADKEVAIKISVEADGGAKSLSELKKEFRETQKTLEGLDSSSKDYIKTLERLGGIKDQIGDLNAEIKAFNPEGKVQAFGNVIGGLASGFQAAQGAAALFGAEGEALQKTLLKVQAASALADGIKGVVGMGDAFKVLGNIVKANPIFLIVGVITAIGGALYALKDKIGFVGKAFDVIGEVITYITDKVKAFTDAIGISNFAMDKLTDSIVDNAKRAQKANTEMYDSKIAQLKRDHEETVFAEIDKQKYIKQTNQLEIDALLRKKQLSEEEYKRLAELRKANHDASQAELDLWVGYLDKKNAKEEASTEKYKAELAKRVAASRALNAELELLQNNNILNQQAREAQITQSQEDAMMTRFNNNVAYNELTDAQREEQRLKDEESLQAKKDMHQAEFESSKALIEATRAITDLVFTHQLNQVKGNAQKEREIKKKQFRVNKAFGIANSIIDGVGAVQKALNNPYPLNLILAIASGLLATANTVKIATTKFDDGGGGAAGGGGAINGSLGSAGGGVALSPPSSGSTQLNSDGTIKKPPVNGGAQEVYVTETSLKKAHTRVNVIESKAVL